MFFLLALGKIFLKPKGPVFEHNRVYSGIDHQFGWYLTPQAGYVNQADYTYTAS